MNKAQKWANREFHLILDGGMGYYMSHPLICFDD